MSAARVLGLLLAVAPCASARADDCRTNIHVAGAPTAEARLTFLRTSLQRNAKYAGIWHGSWTAIYSGLSIYQGTAFALGDHEERIDHSFGLGASLLGLVVLQAMPQQVLLDQPRFERVVRASGDPCEAVAEGERLLMREIAAEKFANGPLVHAGNFIVNFGLLLGLGVGFHHWDTAGLAAGIGIVVGEVQVFTQPRRAQKTLARYRAGLITW